MSGLSIAGATPGLPPAGVAAAPPVGGSWSMSATDATSGVPGAVAATPQTQIQQLVQQLTMVIQSTKMKIKMDAAPSLEAKNKVYKRFLAQAKDPATKLHLFGVFVANISPEAQQKLAAYLNGGKAAGAAGGAAGGGGAAGAHAGQPAGQQQGLPPGVAPGSPMALAAAAAGVPGVPKA